MTGDLTSPPLGAATIPGHIDHVVHLGAIYDFTASAQDNHAANVTGTQNVIDFAGQVRAGWLHHISSVAVAGDHQGRFTEADFDLGQHLPSPYHATKFAAENSSGNKTLSRGGSIGWRSVFLSVDRMHDFERTMALNYFAPLRLTLGLLPHMRERRFGHIVTVTTMGLQSDTPRFSASGHPGAWRTCSTG